MAPKRRPEQPARRTIRSVDDRAKERTNPLKFETTATNQQEQIAQIVAQQIAAALPTIIAQLNQSRSMGNDNTETHDQGLRQNPK